MRPSRSLPTLLPLAVCALTLAITFWLWSHEQRSTQRALRADFDFSVRQTASRIAQRMASYEQVLRGLQGLAADAGTLDRQRFDRYVDALAAGADFAGIQSLSYIAWRPGGPPPLARVLYSAPEGGPGAEAVGGGPYEDPARRAAMLLARDSGGLGITARLAAPPVAGGAEADAGSDAGFAMFLPVYAPSLDIDSLTARRLALAGWVCAHLRPSDLMSSLYGEAPPGIALRLYDGVALEHATLMYRSGAVAADRADAPAAAGLRAQEYIGFAGHSWTLDVSAEPRFAQRFGNDAAAIIAISGVAFSLLLTLLTRQLLTARARAHELARAMTGELRDSEARHRHVVETADEGIWLSDAEGRTSLVNPKMVQLLGYSAEELQGQRLADFGDIADAQPRPAESTPADGGGARREWRFRRKDGSPLWASVALRPIIDAAGAATGQLAMVTDITERKQADAARAQLEGQLRESQKMEAIGTLAGGIAHDFNNILAAILGNVSLALEGSVDAATRAHLGQISQSAARARSLVQQILAFSRRQPHHLVDLPLQPLIAECVRLLRPLLPALVELQADPGPATLHVAGDATQLQQVVMNLCTNAWHALQGQVGRIEIGLDGVELDAAAAQGLGLAAGPHARLWVADDGCGMDEATRARVFEPFFTTKALGEGTGLGLAVVHGIVAVHHGAITVASAPGRGTRFDLYFPRLPAPAAAAAPAVALAAQGAGHGQHVYYVDDDPVMVLMVQTLLRRGGWRVSGFEDPRAALAELRLHPAACELVVCDYNMPGLSGLDLAREIAALRPDLPVVISSGYVSEALITAAAQAGVRAVMQKEYTLEQLGGIVQRELAGALRSASPQPSQ